MCPRLGLVADMLHTYANRYSLIDLSQGPLFQLKQNLTGIRSACGADKLLSWVSENAIAAIQVPGHNDLMNGCTPC